MINNGGTPSGPGGAFYSDEFFTEASRRGDRVRPGRPERHIDEGPEPSKGSDVTVAGGAYAIAVHAGPFVDFDRTYAALGSHVAAHETAAPGPIREIYLVSPPEDNRRVQLPH